MPISYVSAEQFAAAMQHAPIGMAIVALDGAWLWTNGSVCDMLGFDAIELAKTTIQAVTHHEDIETDLEPVQSLLGGQTAAYRIEKRYIHKDGSFVRCLVAVSLVRNERGEPDYFIVTIQDTGANGEVTADTKMSAVQHEQGRFRAAIEAVQGVLWTNDAAGRMVGEQTAWATLTGQRFAEYQGYGWAEAVHPDDAQPSVDAWDLAVAERRTFIFEHRVRRHDGAWRLFAIRAVPLLDASGEIIEWVGVHTDITEQRKAEAEIKGMNAELERRVNARTAELHHMARHLDHARSMAEEANRAKTRFLAGMSHELRTPLNGILGYAQLLRLEGGLNATQAARVNAMLGAGNHLLGMITSVLDMSEIEAGHLALQVDEIDPAGLARECLAMVAAIADDKRLTLNLSTGPGVPRTITGDSTRLRQVLLNLIGNALKFTSNGGVELRLQSAGTGVGLRIEVADTGPGIRADLRHRLFEDFDRLDESGNTKIEGNGLGLAFSARLVALMGGRIGYDDRAGGGSLFWLELPIAASALSSAPAARPGPVPLRAAPFRPLRVLVTDDMAINREIAKAFLQRAGHQVTCVTSGAEAVAATASHDYDIILMDVSMPEMDGMEATRRIRALPGSRGQCPIIAVTAHAFSDQIADCLAAGMTAHLAKPVTQETLTESVARALATGSDDRTEREAEEMSVRSTKTRVGRA